jgi:hypothetical protein
MVIVIDHNALVNSFAGHNQKGSRRVLLKMGEKFHDQVRRPQKNHLLNFGARLEPGIFA